ncbi:MAG: prepilin-type N-terminal cleavage/methylation domain-containing protein [Luminiphilus sp.]|nr:prepilin-type N-terminal cleavage/methylation domain-containing protein [Luminiphilus sp.]
MMTYAPSKQTKKQPSDGFTLLELMFVVAIVGLLVVVAVPAYLDYSKSAKFTEVVRATVPYRLAIEQVVSTASCADPMTLGVLDNGFCGIPVAITSPIGRVASVTVENGIVTATGIASLDNSTFILTPNGVTPPVQWTISGTCITNSIC